MSKINILDSSVFNRIAAGEVVENPRSIVKELVENSIDAGADAITVEIREGGINYISVTDNGKGIEKEDLPIAFLPHATSKIHDMKDLDAITTLGFRGEALPSIASVARVEMHSRTAENELGYKIVLNNGNITEMGECGSPFGTKIIVRNLFQNIPARAKFLRKPKMEESDISEFVVKIILANPSVKIKYIADDKVIYQSDGNSIQSAVYSVYGGKFFENLAEVSYTAPDIQLFGFIAKPNFTKHNRTYQTLIVNGRYISNADISYCIQQCYQPYLMKRQFPAYILYLTLPPDMVDVNVHPNKLDVRFAGEKRLKGILYHTVKSKVDALATLPTSYSPQFQDAPFIISRQTDIVPTKSEIPANPTAVFQPIVHTSHFPKQESPVRIGEENIIQTRLTTEFSQAAASNIADAHPSNTLNEKRPLSVEDTQILSFCDDNLPIRYAGKLFNTYLIAECGQYFYIIDQHAAHEKILYDKLVKQVDAGDTAVQDLLIPYIFDVTATEKVILQEILPEINRCGFKIDPLSGCSFSLYGIPACCADINLQTFVSVLLDNIDTPKKNSDFLKEKLMQAACKSAVKGEEDLSENEINKLITEMQQSNSTKFCPHGRPIIMQCTIADLEKLFKRTI